MAIFNNLNKLFRRSRTLSNGSWSPFLLTTNGKTIAKNNFTTKEALVNSDVFAVINRVSSDVAGCSITAPAMYKKLLDKPLGNVITKYSLIQSIVTQMMIEGNAYVLVHYDSRNRPISLEPIPFEDVKVDLNDKGNDLVYTVTFHDSDRSEIVQVPSDKMLHFRLFLNGESDTQYMGTSPLDALQDELNLQDQSNKLALASIMHSLAPTYTLTIPQGNLGKNAKENIRRSFEQQTTGDNAGRAIVLDQAAKLDTIDPSNKLDNLLDNSKYIQTQIAKAFCIPDEYLNGQGDQQSSTDQIRALYQNSLTLYIQPIEAELSLKFGADVHLDVTNAVDIDHQSLIENVNAMVTAGTITSEQGQQLLKNRGAFPELTITPVENPGESTAEGSEDNE